MTVGHARLPAVLLLESLWGYAAAAVFGAAVADGPAPSLVAVIAAVGGSAALARALQETDLSEGALRTAGLILSIAAVVAIAYVEYAAASGRWSGVWIGDALMSPRSTVEQHGHIAAAAFALACIWVRGVGRGQEGIEYADVLGSATLGLAAVVVAALAAPDAHWPGSFGVLAITYALVALAALALFQAPEPERSIAAFASRWTVAIALVVAASAALTLAVAAFDPDSLGFLEPIARPAGEALGLVALWVLAPVFLAIEGASHGLVWLLDVLLPNLPRRDPPGAPTTEDTAAEEEGGVPLWLRVLGIAFGSVAAMVAAAVALFVVWSAFRRFAHGGDKGERDRRDAVEPASALGDDLRGFVGALTGRFRRSPAHPRTGIEVRRLYFEMLDRAAAEGLDRPAAATPLQFAPQLDAHFASSAPSRISDAFARSRYGELPVDPALVGDLRTAWRSTIERHVSARH